MDNKRHARRDASMIRLSVSNGVHNAILRALDIVAPGPETRVAYVNSTSASNLLRAVESSAQPWVRSRECMEQFHYHRVDGLREMETLLGDYDIVVVERIDVILQELLGDTYEEHNRALHRVLGSGVAFVFLDDWEFLDRYYHRDMQVGSNSES